MIWVLGWTSCIVCCIFTSTFSHKVHLYSRVYQDEDVAIQSALDMYIVVELQQLKLLFQLMLHCTLNTTHTFFFSTLSRSSLQWRIRHIIFATCILLMMMCKIPLFALSNDIKKWWKWKAGMHQHERDKSSRFKRREDSLKGGEWGRHLFYWRFIR